MDAQLKGFDMAMMYPRPPVTDDELRRRKLMGDATRIQTHEWGDATPAATVNTMNLLMKEPAAQDAADMYERLDLQQAPQNQRIVDPRAPIATPEQVRALGARYSPAASPDAINIARTLGRGGSAYGSAPIASTNPARPGTMYGAPAAPMPPAVAEEYSGIRVDGVDTKSPYASVTDTPAYKAYQAKLQTPEGQQSTAARNAKMATIAELARARWRGDRNEEGKIVSMKDVMIRKQREEQAAAQAEQRRQELANDPDTQLKRAQAAEAAARAKSYEREPATSPRLSFEDQLDLEAIKSGNANLDDVRAARERRASGDTADTTDQASGAVDGAMAGVKAGGISAPPVQPQGSTHAKRNSKTGQMIYLVDGRWVDETGKPLQ